MFKYIHCNASSVDHIVLTYQALKQTTYSLCFIACTHSWYLLIYCICQGTSTRRQRKDLLGYRFKLPSATTN